MERINLIEDDIQIVEEEIKEEVKDDKNIELLESVPGVGKLTAMAYVAYIGNGSKFHNASQVAASIGLVPKNRYVGYNQSAWSNIKAWMRIFEITVSNGKLVFN